MKTYFVTRHQGAVEWVEQQGFLDVVLVQNWTGDHVEGLESGDKVLGTLPVQLAAEVCHAGAEYWHLALSLSPEMRGKELSQSDMRAAGATLHRFHVEPA